jgi:hypothetical protein
MNFIGVDMHKRPFSVCVMDQNRKVLARKTIACNETDEIVDFLRKFRPFRHLHFTLGEDSRNRTTKHPVVWRAAH